MDYIIGARQSFRPISLLAIISNTKVTDLGFAGEGVTFIDLIAVLMLAAEILHVKTKPFAFLASWQR